MSEPIDAIRRYLDAIEQGTSGPALAAHFTTDVVQREFPNRLNPAGSEHALPAILAAAERGLKSVRNQQYTVIAAVEQGDRVAAQVTWTAIMNVPFGTLAAGDTMRCHFAMFFTFRDGRIARIENYDCFEPF